MKIYVASSWRNEFQQKVVEQLRNEGYEVYDFKNPSETDKGFAWSDIDPNWKLWTTKEYLTALDHPLANKGFDLDFKAMEWADACVLVMACGRSAHIEAGWMQGSSKPTIVLLEDNGPAEPELMYKMCYHITDNIDEVCLRLKQIKLSDFKKSITGAELINQEREEQLKKHGRGIAADVKDNPNGELIAGAKALIDGEPDEMPNNWNPFICNNMMNKRYKDRLIIAGALIAAEIDRLNHQ